MTIVLNPYLNFRGNAREAMEFYHSVFGGELVVNTFADFGSPVADGEENLVMHSQLTGAKDLVFMASDVPQHMGWAGGENAFSVSLSGAPADDATLRGYFDQLAEGGQVAQPLTAAPWGDVFGMLTDRFGISWLVNISGS